jgi:ABC-type nitrate/sulfonate/bicarbonate transport system substrate-binding protein
MSITDAVAAIKSGKVQAAALWEPYVSTVVTSDPGAFERLRSSFYSEFSVLAALRKSLDEKQEVPYALLRALARASAYFDKNGAEARQTVDTILRGKNVVVSGLAWQNIDIHIGLSATLLTMLNEEARWYHLKQASTVETDMRPLMRGSFMKAVAPHRVTYE